MRARARIVAEADASGATRLVEVIDAAPIALRWTRDAVYLVGTAQGLVAEDDLELEIVVGDGATLRLRSAAATLAYASSNARYRLTVSVGAGGTLDWWPQPLIATRDCHLVATTDISLAKGAQLSWNDECLLGRFDEEPGDLDLSISVDYDGVPLLRHQLLVGAASPAWDGPALLGGARAVGYRVLVGEAHPQVSRAGSGWAVLDLDGPGVVITALGLDHAALVLAMAAAADGEQRRSPTVLSGVLR